MKKGDLISSFVTSISLGALILGGSKLLNFILKILVSQLGVTNFGDYYLATATFLGLTTIAALGVPMSATRFISFLKGKNQSNAIHNIIFSATTAIGISSCVIGAILYTYADVIGTLLHATHTSPYLRILSFGFIGSTITLLVRGALLGLMRIRLSYLTEATEIGLRFVFTIIGILMLRWGVVGALIGYTMGTLGAALINAFILVKVSAIKHFSPQLSGRFLHFTIPVSISEIITATTNIGLLYIIRAKGDADTVGYYAAAVSIAALIHVVPQMVLSVFLPAASRVYAQKKSVLPIYKVLMLWLGVVVLLPSAILIVFGSTITLHLFGPSYSPANQILSVLVTAYAIYALISWPNRQLLDMAGYTKENLWLTTVRILINITALFFVAKNMDGFGLATAMLCGWIGESIGSMLLVKQKRLL